MLHGLRPYLLLSALCLCLYLPGLASLPATDRDEGRHVQATKQMLETGDLIDMRLQEAPYYKKPIGRQWLQGIAVTLTGALTGGLAGDDHRTEVWAYRIPSVVGAWAAVLLTFALGTRLFDRRTALLGAALLGGSLILVVEAHLATHDALLLATVVAAQTVLARLYMTARAGPEGDDSPAGLPLAVAMVFWVAIACGILVKGPIAPFVVLLTGLALVLADRDRHWLGGLRPRLGLPLMLALVLPWFIAIGVVSDGDFYRESLGIDLGAKLVSGQESHGAPPGYFALLMLLTFWPGSLYAWPALWQAVRNRIVPGDRFCLAWLVPAWIVFEAVPTKLPHYTLPLYPALALLTAAAVLTLAGERRVDFRALWVKGLQVLWALPGLALAVAAVAGPIWLGDGPTAWSLIPATAGLATAAAGLWLAWHGRALQATLAALALGSVTMIATIHWILPRLDTVWVSREIATTLADVAPDRDGPVAIAGYAEPSAVFLLGTDTLLADSGADAARHLAAHSGAVAVIDERQEESFQAALAADDLRVETLAEIRGLNYSNGRRLRLTVYRAAP